MQTVRTQSRQCRTFFCTHKQLKEDKPGQIPDRSRPRPKAGSIPGWQVLFSSLEEAGVQGRSPAEPSGIRYVAECPSCVQWMSDNAKNFRSFQFPVIGTMYTRRRARLSRGSWNTEAPHFGARICRESPFTAAERSGLPCRRCGIPNTGIPCR